MQERIGVVDQKGRDDVILVLGQVLHQSVDGLNGFLVFPLSSPLSFQLLAHGYQNPRSFQQFCEMITILIVSIALVIIIQC